MPPFSAGLPGRHTTGSQPFLSSTLRLRLLLLLLTASPLTATLIAAPSSSFSSSFSPSSSELPSAPLAYIKANSSLRNPHFRAESIVNSLLLTTSIPSSPSSAGSSPSSALRAASSSSLATSLSSGAAAAAPAAQSTAQHAAASGAAAAIMVDVQHELNLQSFDSGLGGFVAPAILLSEVKDKPFQVDNETFADFESASAYTCDIQMNQCQQAANKATQQTVNVNVAGASNAGFTVLDCDKQKAQCNEAQIDAPFQTFNLEDIGPDPLDPEFELLCAP